MTRAGLVTTASRSRALHCDAALHSAAWDELRSAEFPLRARPQGLSHLAGLCWASRVTTSWIWFFFHSCFICPTLAPHQQLVAYCFFQKEVDSHAVSLSSRAKSRLLVRRETLSSFPRGRRQWLWPTDSFFDRKCR